jgi:hypothetical protein
MIQRREFTNRRQKSCTDRVKVQSPVSREFLIPSARSPF